MILFISLSLWFGNKNYALQFSVWYQTLNYETKCIFVSILVKIRNFSQLEVEITLKAMKKLQGNLEYSHIDRQASRGK